MIPGTRAFIAAALRYWISEVVGVLALAPFAPVAFTRRHVLPVSLETALQYVAIIAALTMVFSLAEEQALQRFYFLFVPIVWMAIRHGIEGIGAMSLHRVIALQVHHGGRPWLDEVSRWASVRFTLSIAKNSAHD